jgi:superfamily II DNA or RNA helicase
LRPKGAEEEAHFYSLVTRDTREMEFAHHRQLFLTEQGYSYEILDESAFEEDGGPACSPSRLADEPGVEARPA